MNGVLDLSPKSCRLPPGDSFDFQVNDVTDSALVTAEVYDSTDNRFVSTVLST